MIQLVKVSKLGASFRPRQKGDGMRLEDMPVRIDQRVKTTGRLRPEDAIGLPRAQIKHRRAKATGRLKGQVTGSSGDMWWIEHDDGTLAPYLTAEFTPLSD